MATTGRLPTHPAASGRWQLAADANLARQMYPDQGPYPVNSVPEVDRAINGALPRGGRAGGGRAGGAGGGAGYFEAVALAITGGESETTALSGSTEEAQFQR